MLPGKQLSTFVKEINFEGIPTGVKKYVRFCLLDTLGCTIAGAHDAPVRSVDIIPSNPMKEATLIGKKGKKSALDAFQNNAIACSRHDLKRGPTLQFMHPGRLLMLAALTAGEKLDTSYTDTLAAIVVGYEVLMRIGRAVRPIGWPPDKPLPDPVTSLACFTLPGISDIAINLLGMKVLDRNGTKIVLADVGEVDQQEDIASSSRETTISNNTVTTLIIETLSLLSGSGVGEIPRLRSWDDTVVNSIVAEVKRSKELSARLG